MRRAACLKSPSSSISCFCFLSQPPCCSQADIAEVAAAGAISKMPTAAETDHILEVLREDVETALTEAAMAQERQALLQLEVGGMEMHSQLQMD